MLCEATYVFICWFFCLKCSSPSGKFLLVLQCSLNITTSERAVFPSKELGGPSYVLLAFCLYFLFFLKGFASLKSYLLIYMYLTPPDSRYSVQFSSVTQSCPTLCDPMNCRTPGLPVHHQLPEFTQTHVHRVRDAIQPPHPLWSPSPPAPNPSQHQSLFQ